MDVFKRLAWFFKEEKKTYLFGVGALLMVSILQIFPPQILGKVIDKIDNHSLTRQDVLFFILLLTVMAIVEYGFRYMWRVNIWKGAFSLEKKMRSKLFHHFMKMDAPFYQQHRTGDLMAHATNDLNAIQNVAGMGVLTFADSIMTGGTTLVAMMVFVDVRLTILAVLPLPLLALSSNLLGNRIHEAFKKSQEAFSDINSKVQESVTGIKAIQAFGRQKEDVEDFEERLEHLRKTYTKVNLYDSLFDPAITFVVGISYSLTICIGGWLITKEMISIGQMVAFFSYISRLIWPMFSIGYLFNIIQRGNASLTRVEELLEKEPKTLESGKEKAGELKELKVNIQEFSYPNTEEPCLQGVSFTLKNGKVLGVVGKTGSGKSTLAKLLLREYEQFQGMIEWNQTKIHQYEKESYLRRLANVPQESFLFSTSVFENIRFANLDATLEEVRHVAKLSSIDQEILELNKGYDTMVGEKGISLSGGQKQRIQIARALLCESDLLILDDALSAVDAKTEEKIVSSLKNNTRAQAMLIIAHRLSSVMFADEIIVLEDGQIKERGTHEELLDQSGWYAEIWHLQKIEEKEESYGD